jgi:hypothetical protein
MVLAEASGFAGDLGEAALGTIAVTGLVGGGASATAVTVFATRFTALTVLSIFVAFVTVTAAAGLAATDFPDADLAEAGLGAAGLVTVRRLAAFAIALRSDVRAFVLARAASTF